MKNLLKTTTGRILILTIKFIIVMVLVNLSFWLMNMASTVAFICGILLLIAACGFFIEHAYRVYIKQYIK